MSHIELFPNQINQRDLPPFHVAWPELAAPTCQMFEPNQLKTMLAILSGKAQELFDGSFLIGGEIIASLAEATVFGVQRQIRSLPSNAYTGYLLCKKST